MLNATTTNTKRSAKKIYNKNQLTLPFVSVLCACCLNRVIAEYLLCACLFFSFLLFFLYFFFFLLKWEQSNSVKTRGKQIITRKNIQQNAPKEQQNNSRKKTTICLWGSYFFYYFFPFVSHGVCLVAVVVVFCSAFYFASFGLCER